MPCVVWNNASTAAGSNSARLAAGQAQAMGEVLGHLLAGQSAQVMTYHDALGQRLMHRHA